MDRHERHQPGRDVANIKNGTLKAVDYNDIALMPSSGAVHLIEAADKKRAAKRPV